MKWIKTSDKLPMDGQYEQEVLVYTDRNDIRLMTFIPFITRESCSFADYELNRWNLEEITHWMELPEEPKE